VYVLQKAEAEADFPTKARRQLSLLQTSMVDDILLVEVLLLLEHVPVTITTVDAPESVLREVETDTMVVA
jgi:hypothetical protein